MSIAKLIKKLNLLHQISSSLQEYLENHLIFRRQLLHKNEGLLIPGKSLDEVHYMPVGLAKYYRKNEDNKEEIYFFWEDDTIIFLDEFFSEDLNIDFYIMMLEDSELYTLSRAQMKEIHATYPEAYKLTDKLRKEMADLKDKHILILLKKPHERYALFLKLFPGLRNRLTVEDIASFLGISLKTLNSSKRELALKDRKKKNDN